MARVRKLNPALAGFVDEAGKLPTEALLGHLVMFTVGDAPTDKPYDLAELYDQWTAAGLDTKYLPVPNRPIDAFLKATSEVDNSDYKIDDDRVAHVLVRDLSSDNETVIRQFTREIRDNQAKRLAYGRIGTAIFYKPKTEGGKVVPSSARTSFRPERDLDQLERDAMNDLILTIQAKYSRYANYLDSTKIRAMVRATLLGERAILVKPSVYFVHSQRLEELERFSEAINALPNCAMYLIPILDIANQREFIVEAFRTEAVGNLEKVLKEVDRVKDTRKNITPEAFNKVKEMLDETISANREHARVLGNITNLTESAEELAREAVTSLAKEMLK